MPTAKAAANIQYDILNKEDGAARDSNRNRPSRGPSDGVHFSRASHSAVGRRVTSNHSSCRRPWPRTRNANNRSKVSVGTTHRSMAAIACAQFRKNVFQLCDGDPPGTMYLETVDWAISKPSISSSPWIRDAPHSEF